MRPGYGDSSGATHLVTELITRPIETENDGAGLRLLRLGFGCLQFAFRPFSRLGATSTIRPNTAGHLQRPRGDINEA